MGSSWPRPGGVTASEQPVSPEASTRARCGGVCRRASRLLLANTIAMCSSGAQALEADRADKSGQRYWRLSRSSLCCRRIPSLDGVG